jgi:tetratricopeptide (TPR) repeat protein
MTKLILIAAAGMDWAGFDRETRCGALPRLGELRNRGFAGSITGAPAGEGLAAYASLATGVHPETHGVWSALEAWGGGLRPTGRASWRVAPLWARLEAAGLSTGGVGWPAIRPGSAWAGLHLDETFADPTGKTAADWSLPLNCAPAAAREKIASRRVHPTHVTAEMIRGFVPQLQEIDQSRPTLLPALALAMARAATHQAGAVWLLGDPAPDAVFVFHGLLAQVRASCDGRREPAYASAAKAAWLFLDSLVGRLADVAGPDALVLVVSPGWRGRAGVVLAAGPTAPSAPDFLGADLLDIAPTVLGFFGLQDPDLPGRALAPLRSKVSLALAPSPPPAERIEPDRELLRMAAADGCPRPSPAPAAWRSQKFAELGFMLLRRAPEAAEKATAEALRLDPDNVQSLRIRATALFALERAEELLELAEPLERMAPGRGWGALARGAHHVLRKERALAAPWLASAEGDPETETLLTVAAAWLMIESPDEAERVFKRVLEIDPANASAETGMALAAMGRRDFVSADLALRRAAAQDPGRVAIYQTMAKVYHATGRKDFAARAEKMARRLGPPAELPG